MSTIPELTKHARELMHKAIESTKREFTGIRSGKASTSLLDIGAGRSLRERHVPLNQVGHGRRARAPAAHGPALRQVAHPGHREGHPRRRPRPQPGDPGQPDPGAAARADRRSGARSWSRWCTSWPRRAGSRCATPAPTRCPGSRSSSKSPRTTRRGREKDIQKLTDDHIKQIDGLIHAKEAEIMEV